MKTFSSKLLFYGKKQEREMSGMRIFGGDKMGSSGRSPEVQMQELRERVHVQKEGHGEDEQVRVVQVVDIGQTDIGADIRPERIQHAPAVKMVR